ncbi:MAG: phosphoribosyltransferase family protein [Syntrophales bacterium]|nr:phosphoribosyltransferase family protein [Syntrophales bacterium]
MTYYHPPFQNRSDAGRILAESLKHYQGSDVLVFAIPRGGIPVAVEVAKKLGSKLDIIVPRKIPTGRICEGLQGARK